MSENIERRSDWALPASIALGAAFIGAGLYFGLRASAPASPSAPGVRATELATSSSAETVRTPPPGITPERQREIDAAAAAAVAELKPRLVERCWAPSTALSSEPERLDFRLRLLFDPAGRATASAIADSSDPRRADVVACLRSTPIEVEVGSSPSISATELVLTLP